MALSDDQIVNIWGREPRYHAAPIGSTDIAFARAVEAEVRKAAFPEIRRQLEAEWCALQDLKRAEQALRKQYEALIRQMLDAVEQLSACHDEPGCPAVTVGARAIEAARAQLGEKA